MGIFKEWVEKFEETFDGLIGRYAKVGKSSYSNAFTGKIISYRHCPGGLFLSVVNSEFPYDAEEVPARSVEIIDTPPQSQPQMAPKPQLQPQPQRQPVPPPRKFSPGYNPLALPKAN
jgi:hypothetical protein